MFRENEIIILIGAGCSADAGIPTSRQMVQKLEELLRNNGPWRKYETLYYCVKSSILYADGIQGISKNNYDIERLVNTLGEVEKKENSILYPFIGSWKPRLLEIAGYNFDIIKEFKREILEKLREWVSLSDHRSANYYEKFFHFQSEYNFSLRIFSLNYDTCLEKNTPQDKKLERGFDPQTRAWEWRRFEPREEYQYPIYLYKLHGSIDWERDKKQGDILKEVDNIPEVPDLIFGTDYKMQYIDPYLFYAYELRKYSLETRVILVIGYSFGDEHINGILSQALKNNGERKLILISPHSDGNIVSKLQYKDKNQIISISKGAKDFLNEDLKIENLNKQIKDTS